MALDTSYGPTPTGSPAQGSGAAETPKEAKSYWPLSKLRRCYTDFLMSKRRELDEQIDARRYYHGSQWTEEQIKIMKKRKQPIMTFNRIARKIDGVVGLIEKLRQDPKAYARTPQHAQGADLATAAIRYVLDEQEWKAKSPIVASDGAVDGIGGIEIEIVAGDQGDPEIGFEVVDTASFFYDPRSYKDDFSDARYQGIGKWLDDDIAKTMFRDAPEDAFSSDFELTNNSDREIRWFSSVGEQCRVRIVDIWYKHEGGWCYAIFSGNAVLMEGKSYLQDEKKKDICKYLMFSGNVDQDGDRYGFIRNMKSAQDGINARQSKMQHILASRRLILSQGAVDDIEKIRAEWARPDGVVMTNRPVNEGVKADDQSFDFAGWTKMLELNLQEIENFGPNPALIGQGLESQSGRAIALLQQAGMAELGPYILAYRGWKIRVYRAIWNAIQQHWKAERWIRVTDDQNLAQFVQVNGLQIDPQTGMPAMVNAVGSLDVDIIMDEGPDHVNGMADVYETLSNVLPSIAPLLNPVQAQNIIGVLMETSPLPADVKKKFMDQTQQAAQQPPPVPPEVQAAQAKAQIDAQAAQQAAQLKAQQAQNDAQIQAAQAEHAARIKQQQSDHDAILKEQEAIRNLQLAERELEAELRALEIKTQQQLVLEAQKSEQQIHIKAHDYAMRSVERSAKEKANGESNGNGSEAQADAGEIKAIVSAFESSVKAIADAVTAKKTITVQRSKSGYVATSQ